MSPSLLRIRRQTHIFRSNRALGNFYEHRNVTFCRDSKFSIYKPGSLYIESVFGQLSQDFFAFFHTVLDAIIANTQTVDIN